MQICSDGRTFVLSPSLSSESVCFELCSNQSFGQIVSVHQVSVALLNKQPSFGILLLVVNMLPKEMTLDVEILRTIGMLLLRCQSECAAVVLESLADDLNVNLW